MFAYARTTEDKGQIGMLSRLLNGTRFSSFVFYMHSRLSRSVRRSVESDASAQVLGTSAAADHGYLLRYEYCKVLDVKAGLPVKVYTVSFTKRFLESISLLINKSKERFYFALL